MKKKNIDNIVEPTKDVVLETKISNEVQDLNLEQLEYYDKEIRKFQHQINLAKKTDQLEEIDKKFQLLKKLIIKMIDDYKKKGFDHFGEEPKDKSIGDYKDAKKYEFLIAKITHQSFNIPILIEKIISIEMMIETLEESLVDKKATIINPKMKWELIDSKKFNVNKESSKIKRTFEQQKIYIDKILLSIYEEKNSEDAFEKQLEKHIEGINTMVKKTEVAIESFDKASLSEKNILGLSVSIGLVNNLLKGVKALLTLENIGEYIDYVTYSEQIAFHLNDYTLVDAVSNDSMKQLETIKSEILNNFGKFNRTKQSLKKINEDLNKFNDILFKKDQSINELNIMYKEKKF